MTKSEPKPLQKRIARGAVAHYEDGPAYDQSYRRRRADVRFYVRMAEESRGPVLELGAGTGRVTTAIARSGIEVVGVEPSAAMRAQALQNASKLPLDARTRLSFRSGDARRLSLRRRFPLLIAPFNVLMHFYTRRDIEQLLRVVTRHLAPRGRFVFDVSMPDLRMMVRDPRRLYRGPEVVHPISGKRYAYFEAFEYAPVEQVQMVAMIHQSLEEPTDMTNAPLSQRQFFPEELEALLHYNGLAIESRWGDFDRGPLDGSSESQIIVAKRRG